MVHMRVLSSSAAEIQNGPENGPILQDFAESTYLSNAVSDHKNQGGILIACYRQAIFVFKTYPTFCLLLAVYHLLTIVKKGAKPQVREFFVKKIKQ